MIKKYNKFINEKLTDNLKGFNEEGLKQQFINKEIGYNTYIDLCKEYNFKLPSNEILLQFVNNQTSLIHKFALAAQFNLIDKVKELLKTEKITDNISNFAFKCLGKHKNLKTIKLLIDNGADNFDSLLINAIFYKNIELIKQLLEYGFIVKEKMLNSSTKEINVLLQKYYDKQHDK